jgi:hypothetical protein
MTRADGCLGRHRQVDGRTALAQMAFNNKRSSNSLSDYYQFESR